MLSLETRERQLFRMCQLFPEPHHLPSARLFPEKALGSVGVDLTELTEADEFFGTAALKSYNTFVRPRPKQLSKVKNYKVQR